MVQCHFGQICPKWLSPEIFDSTKLTLKHQTHPPQTWVAQCNACFALGSPMDACVGTLSCHFGTVLRAKDQNQRIFHMFGKITPPKPSQNELGTKNWSILFPSSGQGCRETLVLVAGGQMQPIFCVCLLNVACNAIC